MTEQEEVLFKAHADTTALLQKELSHERSMNRKLQDQLETFSLKIKELEEKLNAK